MSHEIYACMWKTHLENFHETGDVQLCVQRKIVHICNEVGDFLFQAMESLFKRVKRLVGGITTLVVGDVIV